MTDVLDAIRDACARVARGARFVSIDDEGLTRWVGALPEAPVEPDLDPSHHRFAEDHDTLAYIFCMDAINFGSGWFPHLNKRPGGSGYFTIARCLRERFEREGAWDAISLQKIDAEDCARIFEQPGREEVVPLMELFARALRDLGAWVETRHAGSFLRAVEAAGGRAATLVGLLAEMPLYRDVSEHDGQPVPLYKRAQITAADLATAFEGRGAGRFEDLDRLTIFADNLVPHVLRMLGVLRYDAGLLARIERGELLDAGSREEVEIRAVALHAVERAVPMLRERGVRVNAQQLDQRLWSQGQRPEFKAQPRHRCRSVYY